MRSIQREHIKSENSNHSLFFQKGGSDFLHGENNKPFFNTFPIQPKLTVNQPGERQKKENSNSSESNNLIQKKTKDVLLQRQATEKDPCPNYEKGEVETSHTQKGHLNSNVFFPTPMSLISRQGDLIIADFGVDWGSVKESAKSDPIWQQWRSAFENNPEYSLEIIGYSDCTGVEKRNDYLRKRRAKKVFQLLDNARARVTSYSAAPENEYLIDNASSYGRAVNRGVAIHFSRTFSYEPDIIEVKKQKPKPKPKTKPEKVDTADCNKSQIDALARAKALAKKMVRAALGEVDNEILMKKYFGKDAMSHRNHIRQNFVSILNGLKWGPTFECEESDSWWCDGAVARVLPIIGLNIHICPAAIAKGDDYLARTLVHEAGHGFAFIFMPDHLCEGGWSGSTTDAEDNADCYGEFAGDVLKL